MSNTITLKKLHVRSGDQVVIISGKDKGKKGKVLSADPRNGKVVVEGVNLITKHMKARGVGQPGGKIIREAAVYASKAMLICPHCNTPARSGHKFLTDGEKVRVCKKCGDTI